MEMQLSIFWIKELESFDFGWKEFKLSNFLDSYKTDWSRIKCYIHHAWSEWYEWTEKTVYFLSEKERDKRLEFLNNYYWTDVCWNNIYWYYPCWIFIQDNPEIVQTFWDITIYWIWLIENSPEKMIKLIKDKNIFLKKTIKKNLTKDNK